MLSLHWKKWSLVFGVAAFAAGFAAPLSAQSSDAILNALIKKGVLTQQEADDIRKDASSQAAPTPVAPAAHGISFADYVQSFRIFGDIRLRYEDRTARQGADHIEMDRFRYRLRFGSLVQVSDDLSFGLRFETNTNARSGNVNFGAGNGSNPTTGPNGPFSKDSSGLYVGQIYVQYKPTSDIVLTAGRMPLPITSTSLVWYQDESPEGLAEKFKFTADNVELTTNLAQFEYAGTGIHNNLGSAVNTDPLLMFAWQESAKIKLADASVFNVSPVLYNYVNTSQTRNPSPFKGVYKPGAETPPNNLLVLEIPIDYTIVVRGTPIKFFGDYAHNFDADARARKFGRPDLNDQDNAFQIGAQYGDAKKKGQWDARVFYQETQIFAVDTNLVDPDIFDSRANLKGFVLQAHYAISNGAQLGITLARGNPVNSSVITSGSSGDTLAQNVRWDNYSLAQFDLIVKF